MFIHSSCEREAKVTFEDCIFISREQIQTRNLCGKVCLLPPRALINCARESYQIKEVGRNIPCGHIEVHGSEKKNQIKSWHSFNNCNMFIKRHVRGNLLYKSHHDVFIYLLSIFCVLVRIYQVMRF